VSAGGSPFQQALEALVRAGVDFVVVGVGGINFYARDASEIVRTIDLDLLLSRRVEALARALSALASEGFRFEAGGEPFVDSTDDIVLERVVAAGSNVVATREGASIDLMCSLAGFTFGELAADAEPFRLGAVEISVGKLEKLLRSKELAGRAKDREFLRLFAARLRDAAERED